MSDKIKIAYFELFHAGWHEDYSINAKKYGGGAIFPKWAKEFWNNDGSQFEFVIFAPKKCWEHIDGAKERKDCFIELPENYGKFLLNGGSLKQIIPDIDYFDFIMIGHTGVAINNAGCRPVQVHWAGFGKASDGHPFVPYSLLYGKDLSPAFPNQKTFPVKIGKPVPPNFRKAEKEDYIFICSSHDESKHSVPLAKECIKNNIKGIFAGVIQKNYKLLDYIDNVNTFFIGEISDNFKYKLARKARLSAFLGTCPCVFSLGVVEMLAHGTPILRNDTKFGDWLEETIVDGQNGLVYNGNNFLECWEKSKNINQEDCWKTAQKYSAEEMVKSFEKAMHFIVEDSKIKL